MPRSSCSGRGNASRRPGPGSSPITVSSLLPRTSRSSSGSGKPPTSSARLITRRAMESWKRYHRTLKEQAIRPKTPLILEDAQRVVGDFVDHYNAVRLHAGIGYIAPLDRLAERHTVIFAARDKKLEAAREIRRLKRQQLNA